MDLIPCETCDALLPFDRYESHQLLCAMWHPRGSGLGGGGGGGDAASYEDNLRAQEAMGGPVKRACRDVDLAAPVADGPGRDPCPVCLETPSGETVVRRGAVCGHEFCARCLETWLSEHTTCPICVADLSVNGGARLLLDAERPRPDWSPVLVFETAGSSRALEDLRSLAAAAYHIRRVRDLLRVAVAERDAAP